MTILGLLIINLFVGASIAFGARVQIKNLQRTIFNNRYFASLLMLEFMVLLPIGLYYYAFYPDWSWMYLHDSRLVNFEIKAMIHICYLVSAILGYIIGYFSARSNSNWITVIFMFFLFCMFIALFVVARDKFLFLGTYDQYQNKVNLIKLSQTSLLPSIIVTSLGLFSGWGYTIFYFWKEGYLLNTADRK